MKKLLIAYLFIACNAKTKVIITDFITVTNPSTGMGLYSGKTLEGEYILFNEKVCMFGIGDTVEILNEQIEGIHNNPVYE